MSFQTWLRIPRLDIQFPNLQTNSQTPKPIPKLTTNSQIHQPFPRQDNQFQALKTYTQSWWPSPRLNNQFPDSTANSQTQQPMLSLQNQYTNLTSISQTQKPIQKLNNRLNNRRWKFCDCCRTFMIYLEYKLIDWLIEFYSVRLLFLLSSHFFPLPLLSQLLMSS